MAINENISTNLQITGLKKEQAKTISILQIVTISLPHMW